MTASLEQFPKEGLYYLYQHRSFLATRKESIKWPVFSAWILSLLYLVIPFKTNRMIALTIFSGIVFFGQILI